MSQIPPGGPYDPYGGQPPGPPPGQYPGQYGQYPGQQPPYYQPPPGPSGGLKAIAIVSICLGSLCAICLPIGMIANMAPMQQSGQPGMPADLQDDLQLIQDHEPKALNLIVGLCNEVLAICLIISGIGTLSLRPWARMLALFYGAASVMLTVIGVILTFVIYGKIMGQLQTGFAKGALVGGMCVSPIISLIYPVIVLWFYNRSNVKEQFGVA